MIEGTAIREIRFKGGRIIYKGDTLALTWPDAHKSPTLVEVEHRGERFLGEARSSLAWIGLTVSMEELSEAVEGDTCETPGGHTVEPDGVDEAGIPSWLLICGLI